MNKLLTSNSAKYRMLRTIIQGVIGVLIANVDLLVGSFSIPIMFKPMVAAIVMAILSPIMAEWGIRTPEKLPEIPEDEDIPDAD